MAQKSKKGIYGVRTRVRIPLSLRQNTRSQTVVAIEHYSGENNKGRRLQTKQNKYLLYLQETFVCMQINIADIIIDYFQVAKND